MASGYGLNGGPSRCFPFWQELLACYVVNSNGDNSQGKGVSKCVPAYEDYHECLHHRKEAARVRAIQAAYRKKMLEDPRADAPTGDQIRKLGLLDKTPEELDIKVQSWLPDPSPKRRSAF
ncbi:hypothetical protein NA57DRAFT_72675 [Rhizodiscina lignyota]|uniref:NADH dehydrogenase [ubiquinone] iron-sulfur protein 5 n=1 Tax=Rhizodiscina lignyota TaxID=1504668 RepID=A0A9P4M857_9PEZI|nr:hypothetical protein NA57DRAFT_72675 [Rhizodiscina lignyota]